MVNKLQNTINEFKTCELNYNGLKQKEIQTLVKSKIQIPLFEHLSINLPDVEWNIEYPASKISHENQSIGDKFDIYGYSKDNDTYIIIEIDTCRADQISKKFVSRYALTSGKNIIYGIILYSNSHQFNKHESKEVVKYLSYINRILKQENKGFVYRLLYE